MSKNKYYAVKYPDDIKGIYNDWDSCQLKINGVPSALYKGFKTIEEAENYMNSKDEVIVKVTKKKNTKKNFYAVKSPKHIRGIYDSWELCKEIVSGVSSALYKGFETREEAEKFLGPEPKEHYSKKTPLVTSDSVKKVILGNYDSLKSAVMDCEYTSQAEAYLRLFNGDNIFITGPAGSGKSFVVQQYCDIMIKINPNIKIYKTSTTGLSAANIGGETIHSYMGYGMNKLSYEDYNKALETELRELLYQEGVDINSEDPFDKVMIKESTNSVYKKKKFVLKRLAKTDILIIDEISMMSASMFNFLRGLVDESKSDLQLIVSGDFSQLPPVAKKEDILEHGEDLAKFCYKTDSWNKFEFTTCYLDKLYRAKDIELGMILDKISLGFGREVAPLLNKLPRTKNKFNKGTALLLSTNANVDKINKEEQEKNTGEEYFNKILYSGEEGSNYYKKSVRYTKNNNIPEELTLKIGDTIMCTRNVQVDPMNILVNGARNSPLSEKVSQLRNGMIGEFVVNADNKWGIKVSFKNNFIEYYFDEPHKFEQEDEYKRDEKTDEIIKVPSNVWCSQYPFKLAYAITIHKSQGQTFSHITIDLTKCWTEGLGYVAISRAMTLGSIVLLENDYGEVFNSLALKINPQSLIIKRDTKEAAKKARMEYIQENIKLFENLDEWIKEKTT